MKKALLQRCQTFRGTLGLQLRSIKRTSLRKISKFTSKLLQDICYIFEYGYPLYHIVWYDDGPSDDISEPTTPLYRSEIV